MGHRSSKVDAAQKADYENKKKFNKSVDKMVDKLKIADEARRKLLILGAGESGKSTLFKQWKTIYGTGFSQEEREGTTRVVCRNTTESMQTLLLNYKQCGQSISDEAADAEKYVLETKDLDSMTEEMADAITKLWNEQGIKETFNQRAKFQILDSAEYLFNRVLKFAEPDYIPTDEDCLKSRIRTTGVVEQGFLVDGKKITVIDVGGQRSERKKWIHCFEDVTCILFIAAINEYDQKLFEDENVPRMEETLTLFQETLKLKYFKNTNVILFLNKTDLFEEKFKRVPLKNYFPEFQGTTLEDGKTFMEKKFVQAESKTGGERDLFIYFTNATDQGNIRKCLQAVQETILRGLLEGDGII
jgi:GTPase SAR1 family protein